MATKQIILGGSDADINTGAVRYGGINASGWSTAENSQSGLVSTGGVFKNFQVKLGTAPGSGKSWVFTVRKNGVDTALSVSIADTATTSAIDTSEVTFAAGDIIGITSTPTGTPTATGSEKHSIEFIPTTAGQTVLISSTSATNLANGQYTAIQSPKSPDATEFDAQILFPTAGVLKNFYVLLSTAPGAGTSRAFTVRKNASTTGEISVTIADTATTGNNTATELTVAAGDSVAILDTDTGAVAASVARFGLTFIPTTAGEFITCATTDDNLNNAATEYQYLTCADSTLSATEADFECLSVSATTVKKIYVKLQADPGTNPDAYTFNLRQNGGATALGVTITADATTGNASADVAVSAGDVLNYEIIPVNTPSATPHTQIGLLLYNAPTSAGIAFDSCVELSGVSQSFTIPTGNPILFVSVQGAIGSDSITGVTVAGNSATLVDKVLAPGTNARYCYLFVYQAPPTGSQTIAITGTGLADGWMIAYTGAAQSGQVDVHGTATNADASTSIAKALTSTVDNCWMVAYCAGSNGNAVSAGSGTTLRSSTTNNGMFDSNSVITPAGSYTLNVNTAGSSLAILAATFSPVASASGPANVKTFQGIAKASVKTLQGVALASVKSSQGVV